MIELPLWRGGGQQSDYGSIWEVGGVYVNLRSGGASGREAASVTSLVSSRRHYGDALK